MAFEIVCCISSHDSSVYNHVSPLALHAEVSKVWIVRSHRSAYGEVPKAEYLLTGKKWLPLKLIHLLWLMIRIGSRPEVKAYASFNPIPYGLLAQLAAAINRKPIHLGFIGEDMDRHMRGPLGRFLFPIVRRADFITVTGNSMRDFALSKGIASEKCFVLPHGIDLGRYPVVDNAKAKYDFLHVGELIQRKRVDIIIRALAEVLQDRPEARLALVGRGPLENELKQLAATLGVSEQVDFVGYVSNVQPYYAQSRIVVVAAEGEGFPFALVEGTCSGLVPISTPVGTILDHIHEGENGVIVPVGDVEALSGAMRQLLDDPALYSKLRERALDLRDCFSFEATTKVWGEWISRMHGKQKNEN